MSEKPGPADYVHTVTIRDETGLVREQDWPVHVPSGRRMIGVEFDGVGVAGVVSVEVFVAAQEATTVVLEVLPEYAAPGFWDSTTFVPCAIDGHLVLTPYNHDDPGVCDWSMSEHEGLVGDTMLCPILVAGVTIC